MRLTGVAGWPVAHSRSPALHAAGFADLGLHDWQSQLLPLPPELFAETVRALPDAGFVGINVTIPHKAAAAELADRSSDVVRACGAANTLTFDSGAIVADNTDVAAIESAVRELIPAGGSAMVLGAGGTARAALVALGFAGVEQISIWNRTYSRAVSLSAELGGRPTDAVVGADLIVNTTSIGLADRAGAWEFPFPAEFLGEYGGLIDLPYAVGGTQIVNSAREAAVPVIDGLEILVRQGARSLAIWTGREPELETLRAAVRDG